MTTAPEDRRSHRLSGVPKEARPYQGRPAGIVTRTLAAIIDTVVVLALLAGVFLLINAVVLAVRPLNFQPVVVPVPMTLIGGVVVAIGYLTTTWATTGRTVGNAVLGLRVVAAGSTRRLGPARACVRATTCTLFPIGLAWAALSVSRRSLHDRLVGSAVVYQWAMR